MPRVHRFGADSKGKCHSKVACFGGGPLCVQQLGLRFAMIGWNVDQGAHTQVGPGDALIPDLSRHPATATPATEPGHSYVTERASLRRFHSTDGMTPSDDCDKRSPVTQ